MDSRSHSETENNLENRSKYMTKYKECRKIIKGYIQQNISFADILSNLHKKINLNLKGFKKKSEEENDNFTNEIKEKLEKCKNKYGENLVIEVISDLHDKKYQRNNNLRSCNINHNRNLNSKIIELPNIGKIRTNMNFNESINGELDKKSKEEISDIYLTKFDIQKTQTNEPKQNIKINFSSKQSKCGNEIKEEEISICGINKKHKKVNDTKSKIKKTLYVRERNDITNTNLNKNIENINNKKTDFIDNSVISTKNKETYHKGNVTDNIQVNFSPLPVIMQVPLTAEITEQILKRKKNNPRKRKNHSISNVLSNSSRSRIPVIEIFDSEESLKCFEFYKEKETKPKKSIGDEEKKIFETNKKRKCSQSENKKFTKENLGNINTREKNHIIRRPNNNNIVTNEIKIEYGNETETECLKDNSSKTGKINIENIKNNLRISKDRKTSTNLKEGSIKETTPNIQSIQHKIDLNNKKDKHHSMNSDLFKTIIEHNCVKHKSHEFVITKSINEYKDIYPKETLYRKIAKQQILEKFLDITDNEDFLAKKRYFGEEENKLHLSDQRTRDERDSEIINKFYNCKAQFLTHSIKKDGIIYFFEFDKMGLNAKHKANFRCSLLNCNGLGTYDMKLCKFKLIREHNSNLEEHKYMVWCNKLVNYTKLSQNYLIFGNSKKEIKGFQVLKLNNVIKIIYDK